MEYDITEFMATLQKKEEKQLQIAKKHVQAQTLKCPVCGEKGKLMEKTTVSKGKYRYKKLYVYHCFYPNSKKPSYRKQKWCYLNKKTLEEPILKEKVTTIKNCTKSWEENEYSLRKLRKIVCPECKKELIVEPYDSHWFVDNAKLICLDSKHEIAFLTAPTGGIWMSVKHNF